MELTINTLLGDNRPEVVDVLRAPGQPLQQMISEPDLERDAFKKELGLMLMGGESERPSSGKPLTDRIKEKFKKWFSKKRKEKAFFREEDDPANTQEPADSEEEVISFYAPVGLRKGERNG
jgi:hypothetical protein